MLHIRKLKPREAGYLLQATQPEGHRGGSDTQVFLAFGSSLEVELGETGQKQHGNEPGWDCSQALSGCRGLGSLGQGGQEVTGRWGDTRSSWRHSTQLAIHCPGRAIESFGGKHDLTESPCLPPTCQSALRASPGDLSAQSPPARWPGQVSSPISYPGFSSLATVSHLPAPARGPHPDPLTHTAEAEASGNGDGHRSLHFQELSGPCQPLIGMWPGRGQPWSPCGSGGRFSSVSSVALLWGSDLRKAEPG